ncbi:DUF4157 domain-containing protein [Roseivirga sp. BDSF3-8]|uniref:eCIS core domain-containing protein n=1 Tax=Roseivirga sp. BDSF3-8 TaxID=3241598 RepID=UPI0035323BB1
MSAHSDKQGNKQNGPGARKGSALTGASRKADSSKKGAWLSHTDVKTTAGPENTAQLQAIADAFGPKGALPPPPNAPVQRQENKTGLPDQLKSGIENLSGYSMDDVKVHYNSSRPAQLQAHAYAQGTDIHMAPGQEQHLPHEAWHVVQQKQGRVQPTKQLKGKTAVNDDAGLEHEADVMGARAMQFKLTGGSPLAPVAVATPVVQRVLSRFELGDAGTEDNTLNVKVWDMIVAGRTPSPYSNTMGAHSTAWIAHIDAVRRHVVGYHLDDACRYLIALGDEHLGSELLHLSTLLEESHRNKLGTAEERLRNKKDELEAFAIEANITDKQAVITGMREYVDAYLTFVNYMPTSTLQQGDPRGHGEGEAHGYVNTFEYGLSLVDDSDLTRADLANATPNTQDHTILTQNLKVIEENYNDVVKAQGDVATRGEDNTKRKLWEKVWAMFAQETPAVFSAYQVKRNDVVPEIWALTLRSFLKTIKKAYPYTARHIGINDEANLRHQLGLYAAENNAYVPQQYALPQNRVDHVIDLVAGRTPFALVHSMVDAFPEEALPNELENEAEPAVSAMGLSDFVKGGTGFMSTLLLDEQGNVGGIEFNGRTPSPFGSRGMGAHSTAWIAYLDAVRNSLKGRSLLWASLELGKMSSEAMRSPVYEAFRKTVDEKHAHYLSEAFNLLNTYVSTCINLPADPTGKVAFIENFIYAYLNFMNHLPLATVLTGSVPDGRGEGRHRKVLTDFEDAHVLQGRDESQVLNEYENYGGEITVEQRTMVREALEGLLDVNSIDKFVVEDGPKPANFDELKWAFGIMKFLHIIRKAYPKAYEVSGFEAYILDKLKQEDVNMISEDSGLDLSELSNGKDIYAYICGLSYSLHQKVRIIPLEREGFIFQTFDAATHSCKVRFYLSESESSVQYGEFHVSKLEPVI